MSTWQVVCYYVSSPCSCFLFVPCRPRVATLSKKATRCSVSGFPLFILTRANFFHFFFSIVSVLFFLVHAVAIGAQKQAECPPIQMEPVDLSVNSRSSARVVLSEASRRRASRSPESRKRRSSPVNGIDLRVNKSAPGKRLFRPRLPPCRVLCVLIAPVTPPARPTPPPPPQRKASAGAGDFERTQQPSEKRGNEGARVSCSAEPDETSVQHRRIKANYFDRTRKLVYFPLATLLLLLRRCCCFLLSTGLRFAPCLTTRSTDNR